MRVDNVISPIFAALLSVLICVSVSGGAAAIGGLGQGENWPVQSSLLERVHGFHCRPVMGWDPAAGVYHVHRHEGICRDYNRCMRVMYRCNLVMGRGWDAWTYERWGEDNWRFDRCMLDAGCY